MSSYLACRILPGLLFSVLISMMPHDGAIDGPKSINNSAPAGIGGDGPWNSFNMELLARLPLDEIGSGGVSNVLGNDCWGWTDPQDGREYAICGLTNGTSFVDISDPRDPQYLGRLPSQTGNAAWRDMKVFNNHVFVVSDGNGDHGMQVFDLTQLRTVDPGSPQVFANTAWYNGDGNGNVGSAHNIAINEESGFAYIVGCNRANGGLHVVNINNPGTPVTAGDFADDGYTHDVQVVTYEGPDEDYAGREIAFCSNEDTVTIVDVTNKNNMLQISRNGYSQDAYTHQGWLSEDQRYFYMGDELDESNFGGPTRMHIFDCLDLDNPVYRGYFSGTTHAIDHNLYVRGDKIYSGSYSAGLRVLQAGTDQSQLTEVAFFDTYNTNTGVNFDGVWSVYPYFASGTVLINDRQNGMFLVRLSPVAFDYPVSRPEMVDSAGGSQFIVEAVSLAGSPQPATGVLHIDRGSGFESFPLNELSPNVYDAIFPATHCGTQIQYYVSVTATDGSTVCSPTNAPSETWSAISGYTSDVTFDDDFETSQGWTVGGDALDGAWERGVPAGGGLRADPPADADGSGQCYLTDNVAGNSDVDGGSTILTSPIMDATGSDSMDAVVSYSRWFSNDLGGAPNQDVFVVDISNNGGSTWTNLETVGPDGNEISGGWIRKTFRIKDFLFPTDQMQLRFVAADLLDGSVIEAGVDGVQIQVINCLNMVVGEGSKLLDGVQAGGALASTFDSDEVYLELDPSPTNNPIKQKIDIVLQSTSINASPNQLRFKLEARMLGGPSGDVSQAISLLNYQTGVYDQIDVRAAANSDEIVDVTVAGDPAQYVQPGTREVTAKVTWLSDSFSGPPFAWSIDIDQAVWLVDLPAETSYLGGSQGKRSKPDARDMQPAPWQGRRGSRK